MSRLLSAAIVVAVTHIGFCLIRDEAIITEARPPKQDLRKLPTRLGPWVAEEVPLDPKRFPDAGAEITVTRIYRNPGGAVVSMYAGVWLEYEIAPPHPPKTCYTGSGYRVVGEKNVRLGEMDRPNVSLRLLLLERDGKQSALLYWYQRGDRVVGNYWVRRTSWRLWGEEAAPPLVKVMLETSAPDPEKAEAQLESIAAPLLAWTKGL